MSTLRTLINAPLFWGAWIIIPILAEILPALGNVLILIRRRFRTRKPYDTPPVWPELSIIVPVYNSALALRECLKSIYDSTYPVERISVMLVDNGSLDDSFSVFNACQSEFPTLNMQWMNAEQGKSRALNLAIYNSAGKYVINMDSDGRLEPHALENMIKKFEANPELNCMTGTILTIPEKIQACKDPFTRLLRELEFMEYAQAFLAGRSYASENNTIYTLSGAFSAFRKSAIMRSWLYNPETICEDTQLTFQLRYQRQERIEVCEDAIFFTDPIEDLNKLYTQRQRWQRGSLEVAGMFQGQSRNPFYVFKDINIRTLLFDHSFAFPRFLWYVVMLCMICMHYSGQAMLISAAVMMLLYVLVGYLYYIASLFLLRKSPEVHAYYLRHFWCVALLPLFNLGIFFARLAGIINAVGTTGSWRTRDLTEEKTSFVEAVHKSTEKPRHLMEKLRRCFNREQTAATEGEGPTKPTPYFAYAVILLLSGALFVTVAWIKRTYGIGLNELITTMTGNLQGTSKDVILAVVWGCVVPVLVGIVVFVLLAVWDSRRKKRRLSGKTKFSRALPVLCVGFPLIAVLFANMQFDVLAYYTTQNAFSGIYEDYYVDPNEVAITPVGEKKNLICIYLESMETTYASKEAGGRQEVNYMPGLTKLAEENISFSNTRKLGGFHTVTGAGYTMAALFSTTTGVPYALPGDASDIAAHGTFASGITGLGDFLKREGYTQEFLCGSDAAFGNRELYFTQHGDYDIFDLFTAREKGYIPPDYSVWWGFEDFRLIDMAKDELTRLSAEEQPFNFTMLTVDLHHVGGYVCPYCGDEYTPDTANVVTCTDRLVTDFVDWCSQQPFYEDTVIVIMGDHPRMDTILVDGVSYYDRTVYNCILNSGLEPESRYDREFTHMDMFPTILTAMGYEIEGDRLGLGTNLFSDQETLAERFGFNYINDEVSKRSSYYLEHFAPELIDEEENGTEN